MKTYLRVYRVIAKNHTRASFLVAAVSVTSENNIVESVRGEYRMTSFKGRKTAGNDSIKIGVGRFDLADYSFRELKRKNI